MSGYGLGLVARLVLPPAFHVPEDAPILAALLALISSVYAASREAFVAGLSRSDSEGRA